MYCVMSCRDTGFENRRPGLGGLDLSFLFLAPWYFLCLCLRIRVPVCVSVLVLVYLSLAGGDKTGPGHVKSRPATVHTPELSNSTGWTAGWLAENSEQIPT